MCTTKRILLLTDSLGCPRREIPVDLTWVDCLMKQFRNEGCIFYTYCEHGLHSNNINRKRILEIEPDLIICQTGIVDACRRAIKQRTLSVAKRIPFISKHINSFLSRNHFNITKKKDIHYATIEDYVDLYHFLTNQADVLAILISQPGESLKEKVFNVEEDVKRYNEALMSSQITRMNIIDPYKGLDQDSYLLSDGHHLNEYGHQVVFEAISLELEKWLERVDIL